MVSHADRWREALAAWSIPDEILAQASDSPWIHPPVLFDVPDVVPSTPSHERAKEALGPDADVLDVGCGGGIAAFGLVPDLRRATGVDHQVDMLALFRRNGERREVATATIEGFWPNVAERAPSADVVTAHHVVYNVSDIVPFLRALTAHARRRVVLELPQRHPLATLTPLWQHFWGIQRPKGPTPDDLMGVLADLGYSAHLEAWEGPLRVERDMDEAAHFTRIRLCLPADRKGEVREYLEAHPAPTTRPLATIWWDVPRGE
jgi:SAM-dependent methyltransferase